MGYREDWFNANPSLTGTWQCCRCKKFFSKVQIEIDHRLPKRDGGTDDLWNLQPMCRHCNRSKRDNQTVAETAATVFSAWRNDGIGKLTKSVATQAIKDALGFKYKR